jgi:hypothetical protein
MVDNARIVALEAQLVIVTEVLKETLYFLGKAAQLDYSFRSHPMLQLVTKLEQMQERIEHRGLTR